MKKTKLKILLPILLVLVVGVAVLSVLLVFKDKKGTETDVPSSSTDISVDFSENQSEDFLDSSDLTTTASSANDINEAELYREYLTGGGYEKAISYYNESPSDFKIESCFVDLDEDGTRELLLQITNTEALGPRGYGTYYLLLGLSGEKVVPLAFCTDGGGSGGGSYLSIVYDTQTQKHVLLLTDSFRAGIFSTYYGLTAFDASKREKAFSEIDSEFDTTDVAFKKMLSVTREYCASEYYSDDIERIRQETDLYSMEEDGLVCWKSNDKYISESEYNKLTARFIEPTDARYQLKVVPANNPAQ